MGRIEGDKSTPDARELVKQRLRAQLADRQTDLSVVDRLLTDRQADLVLEDFRRRPSGQS
jgi:hypothetical protein